MTVSIPIIQERSDDIPIVELRQILRSGCLAEPKQVQGVGRIALRLLRRGAAGMDRRALDEAFDRIAAVLSVQASPDFYALHLRVLRRYLDDAADLLAKVLTEASLDVDELERLKRETVAEIVSSRDDDRYLAARALRMLAFGEHPYGRPARGTIETVSRITLDDVKSFLDAHLVQNNLLIGVAGHASEEEISTVVSRTTGRLPDGKAPGLDAPTPHAKKGVRVLLVDKPDRTQAQMFVGHIGPAPLDPQDMALRVALTAFGGTFTSRLMREVRVKRGWSYGAYATLGRGRCPEVLSLWTFPASKDAADCLALVLELQRDLKRTGPSEEEVTFARDHMARAFALQKDTAPARLSLRLRQELVGLPRDYYDTYPERVRQINTEQAKKACATHVNDEDLTIVLTCTASELRQPVADLVGPDATIDTIAYDDPEL